MWTCAWASAYLHATNDHTVTQRMIAKAEIDPRCVAGPCTATAVTASTVQLIRDVGNLAALVARSIELVCSRLARAVATGNRRRAVGRAARDFVEGHLAGMPVVETDNHHAEVQEIRDDREQRRFLPAVLCSR